MRFRWLDETTMRISFDGNIDYDYGIAPSKTRFRAMHIDKMAGQQHGHANMSSITTLRQNWLHECFSTAILLGAARVMPPYLSQPKIIAQGDEWQRNGTFGLMIYAPT